MYVRSISVKAELRTIGIGIYVHVRTYCMQLPHHYCMYVHMYCMYSVSTLHVLYLCMYV